MSFNGKAFGTLMAALSLLAWTNLWAEMEDPPAPPDISSLDNSLPPADNSSDKDKPAVKKTQEESDALKSLDSGKDAADSLTPPTFDNTPAAKAAKKKEVEVDDSSDQVEVMPPPPSVEAPASVKTEKAAPAKKEAAPAKAADDEIAPPPPPDVPAETPKAAAKSEEPPPPPDATASTDGKIAQYDVLKGDTLWAISGMGSIYGNSFQWPLLFKANRDNIQDPDLIYPEQKFNIRRDFTDEEIQKAIQNASDTPAYVPHTKPRETLPVDYF